MKPKSLDAKTWKKIKCNLEDWYNLNGFEKINLLEEKPEDILFGFFHNLKYPKDIYMFEKTGKYILDVQKIRNYVNNETREVGGTISKEGVEISFIGNQKNVFLDFSKDADILFHTHPAENRIFDPPSVLDILLYLALIVKYIASIIIDLGKGVEHPSDDPLVIQNSMVFSKEGVYVYYISHPLIEKITTKLVHLYLKEGDFLFEVEKLLEEIELSYSYFLRDYNYIKNIEDYFFDFSFF